MITARKLKLSARFFFWAWVLAILAGTLLPGVDLDKISKGEFDFRIDYPVHAMAFFPLPVAACLAWGKKSRFMRSPGFIKGLLFSLVLAIVSEYLQKLVPGRSFNYMDIVSNFSGLCLGLAVAWWISRLKPLQGQDSIQ